MRGPEGHSEGGLGRDVLAGVGAASVIIPGALGYALLAGLPPQAGLGAVVLPTLVYLLLGSKRIFMGPTANVSALVGAGLGGLAAGDASRQLALAATLGLLVGAMLLAAGLLRLGHLTDFISRPVLIGYGLGSVLTVITSQLGPLLGVKLQGVQFVSLVVQLASRLEALRPLPVLFGLGCAACYFLVWRLAPRFSPAAVTLVVATGLVALTDLGERDLAVVGQIPHGTLALSLPTFTLVDARALFPSAFVIFLLVFLDSNRVARSMSQKYGEPLRPNQELCAQGVVNAVAGVSGGFPVSASSSYSRVYESFRGPTRRARLVTALLSAGVLLLAPTFPNLSRAALAAIVMGASVEGVDWSAPAKVWRFSRWEFGFLGVAAVGVLGLGLIPGMLLAVGLSVLALLHAAARPHTARLGVDPRDPELFADLERNPDHVPIPGVLLLRVDAALFFPNASHVMQQVRELVAAEASPLRAVVLDLRAVSLLDFTACEQLERLRQDLARDGIRLAVAEPNARVRSALARVGLAEALGVRESLSIRQALQRLT